MKTLYIIAGTMGVGKTTVCRALQEKLTSSVFLDGDWCWDARPFCVTEETKAMVVQNIRFLLNQFLRCSAYQNVIFCWVMNRQSVLDEILSGLDTVGCSVRVIALVCSPEALAQRLEKDVAAGLRQPDILERSLRRLGDYSSLNAAVIDTTEKEPETVAEEILEME